MGRDVALLAASILALVAFISVGVMFGFWAQGNGEHRVALASVQTVHLDYMHAGWCEYCALTRSDLEAVASELSPRVSLAVWDEARMESDARTRETYERFIGDGLFGGYPTIVANSENMLVGQRSRAEIKEWVCSQFEEKPAQCG